MILLDIVFQLGDFYPQDSSSSFWESLVGAFIGAASVLIIFYLETNREKRKETKIKMESESNTLIYFSSLVQSIIEKSERQIKSYKEHCEKITSQPFTMHPLSLTVAEDLNRVVNKFDHERIFNSYLSKFSNSKDKIEKFRKIYTQLDSTLKVYELVDFSQEAYLKELLDRLKKYKDISEEKILNYCAFLMNKIKNTTKEYSKDALYILLNDTFTKYRNNAPNPLTIEYIQTRFIDVLKEPLVKNFRHIDDCFNMIDDCRKATWLYNETIERAKNISNIFNNYSSDLKKVTDKLKELTSDLNE